MKRRDFLHAAAMLVPAIRYARAQQPAQKKRIAYVDPALNVESMQGASRPFFDEMRRLGYLEGENLIVERYSGGGRIERYQSLAQEVVDTKPDLILSIGAPLTTRFKK